MDTMNKKELAKRYRIIKESEDALEIKTQKCVELYNESAEWNRSYCWNKIYKILGTIPNEIMEPQQLLKELNLPNYYDRLKRFLESKEKTK